MPRPPEPGKRAALLDRCFEAVVAAGDLDLTLDALAAHAGTSARMLVYHFGSREALDVALSERLEERMRARFDALVDAASAAPAMRADGMPAAGRAVLQLWDELTVADLRGLLRVGEGLRARAIRGDAEAMRLHAGQLHAWQGLLTARGMDADLAHALVLLVDGAASELLLTGDPTCGRRSIEAFLRAIGDGGRRR